MPSTRWPYVEATILRHLARRSAPFTTSDAVAAATGLPEADVTYALEALYAQGRVDTAVDEEAVRRWRLADATATGAGEGVRADER
ncbi:MAG: hypothetical protein ABEJ81_04845 [Haloferacaceae archaeon]